jgi:uncharacterized protein (TIGR02270 family)
MQKELFLLAYSKTMTREVSSARAFSRSHDIRCRSGEDNRQNVTGLALALGWVSSARLTGVARELLGSHFFLRCRLGPATCRMHGVDPGPPLLATLNDSHPDVRAEALRAAAAIGRTDMLEQARSALSNDDVNVSARAASAAVLLGDRGNALEWLRSLALRKGGLRRDTLELAVRASDVNATRSILHRVSQDAADIRLLVIGAGVAGDAHYLPWLIRQMEEPKLSRLAGESFSLMTGLDLARCSLDRTRPEGFESGPTEDPDDPNVDMDPDDGLPWPDR